MEQCVSGLMQAEMRKAVVYRVDISLDPIQVIDKAQCWLWQLLLGMSQMEERGIFGASNMGRTKRC